MRLLNYILKVFIVCFIIVGCGRKSLNYNKKEECLCGFNQMHLLDTIDDILEKRKEYENGDSMTTLFLIAREVESDTLLYAWLSNDLDIDFPYDNDYKGSLYYKGCEIILDYVRPLSNIPFIDESFFDKNRFDSLMNQRIINPTAIEPQALRYDYYYSMRTGIIHIDTKEYNMKQRNPTNCF